MNGTSKEYEALASKIIAALTLLDEKGTNATVTRAMSIVYEGFRQHAANGCFSAADIFRSANAEISYE